MTITHYKQICNNIFLNIESFGLIEVKFAQIEDLMFRFNYKVDTLHGGNSIKWELSPWHHVHKSLSR